MSREGTVRTPATGPDLTMLEMIHAALRRDLARLRRALRSEASRWAAQALGRQWRGFADHLHSHHSAEDRLIWPVLEQRAGSAATDVLAAMIGEHETLDPLLATTSELFDRFVVDPTPQSRVALADSLDRLAATLEARLAHEERDAVPLVSRWLTDADLDRAHVLNQMPPPLRMLVRRWQRRHNREVTIAFSAKY